MVKFRCDVMAESKDEHPKENLTLFVEKCYVSSGLKSQNVKLHYFWREISNHYKIRKKIKITMLHNFGAKIQLPLV